MSALPLGDEARIFHLVSRDFRKLPTFFLIESTNDDSALGPPTIPILGNLHQLPKSGTFLKYDSLSSSNTRTFLCLLFICI